jgi:hypothetical protein
MISRVLACAAAAFILDYPKRRLILLAPQL